MTTTLVIDGPTASDLVPVMEDGILSHVTRTCAEHGGDCRCVGNADDSGQFVFWCPRGEHLISFR